MLILKVSKKLFQHLAGLVFLQENAKKKWKILTDILLDVLKISFSIKPKNWTIKLPIGWIDWSHYPLKRSNLPRGNPADHNKELLLHQLRECTKLIIEAKELTSKLDNPNAAPKTHWFITNRFANNKKIPTIPHAIFEGKRICDFEKEVELCNNHLFFVLTMSSQCSLVMNASTLPNFEYKTNEPLFLINENNENDILSSKVD